MLKSEDISKQHITGACAHYAIINLFRLRGAEPPTFEQLAARYFHRLKHEYRTVYRRAGVDTITGLTPTDMLILLSDFHFPAPCYVGMIPSFISLKDFLTPLLLIGANLILSYTWRHPQTEETVCHAVAVESFCDDGFIVLDGDSGFEEGSIIEYEPQFTAEEFQEFMMRRGKAAHGVRRILPFNEMPEDSPYGLGSMFVMANPAPTDANLEALKERLQL